MTVMGKALFVAGPTNVVRRIEIATGDPLVASMQAPTKDSGDVPYGGCAAGVSGLTLLPDGTLTPCRRLPLPLGNVAVDSIRQVFTESPVLTMLRDRTQYTGRCAACGHWAECRGCRAIAYACSRSSGKGDFLGDDPQCLLGIGAPP